MMRRALAIILITCLVATAAAAATDVPVNRDATTPGETPKLKALAAYKQDLINVLALGDAGDLLGAALLARSLDADGGGSRHARLMQRAAAADPDNPAISWARLADCDAAAGNCPNDEALARLKKLAPRNAAVWMLVLDQAARDGDRDKQLEALAKAAASRRYDDYNGALLQTLVQAVTSLPVPQESVRAFAGGDADATGPASVRAFIAYGEAGAQMQPSFLPLMPLCDPAIDEAAGHNAEACRKLAQLLVWGSSPRARAAGLHLQQVLAENEATRRQAKADMRDLAWQLEHFSRLVLASFSRQQLAATLLQLGRSGGSKMSRMAALLHQHDVALEAPVPTASETDPPESPGRTATASSPATAASVTAAAPAATPVEPAPTASSPAPAAAASASPATAASASQSAPAAAASSAEGATSEPR